jgi:YD repeat-containing protein
MTTPLRPTTEELRLSPQNPWPGLPAFTAANSQFFFGRETEIAEIFRRVRRQMLTVLFGVSGLGKTSLLQAGLLPKLGGSPFHPVMIRLDHAPEAEDLIEQVRITILRAIEAAMKNGGVQIPRGPEKGEDLWGYFHDKALDWHNDRGEVVHPVLVFDQFEEIFTRETRSRSLEERKQRFIDVLACLVENRPPEALARAVEADPELSRRYDFRQDDYRVVISLREDFLPHLESLKRHMPSVMENRMRLTRMDREQALQAVIGPGREIVEESVAREIVAFVAGRAREGLATVTDAEEAEDSAASSAVDPALLSLVCDELNRRRLDRKQARISADLLTEEREGIIKGFYERAFEGVDARVREWVEDELLTASGYRDRAAVEDALRLGLPGGALDQLVDRRVLHREEREGVVWLELTHDLLTGPAAQSRSAREQRLQAAAAAERERELARERDAQRRKARRMAWLSRSLAAMLLLVLGLGYWYWDGHVRLHTEHFNALAKHWGIFEGVGRLTDTQVAHRKVSWRLTYKGRRGQLLRVQAVNSRGVLTTKHGMGTYLKYASEDENPERECQWEFIRNARGQVVYEMALDRNTNLVWGFVYSPPTTNQFLRRAHFVGADGMAQAQRNSTAEYVEFRYDPAGRETKILFQDHLGQPQPGPDGAYGQSLEYEARGLVTRRTSLTADGKPMVDSAGNSGLMTEYDDLGGGVVYTALDAKGQATTVKSGWHKVRFHYDEYGNERERQYIGLNTRPVLIREGYARVESKYDDSGNQISAACFDTKEQPTLDRLHHKHQARMAYDERGNLTNWVIFGVTGQPTVTVEGFGQVASRFNDRDQEIERTYLDHAGQRVRCANGYARLTRRFDTRGRVIEESYFDETGRPRRSRESRPKTDGFGRKTLAYDERGNLVIEAFFDGAGQPMRGVDGYARMAASYDERGNRTEEAYFDESNAPVRHQGGYAKLIKRFDERGNPIEESYLDENGRPVGLSDGYSRRKMRYDERNNLVEESFRDDQNRLVLRKEGYARRLLNYDDRGNLIQEVFYDKSGENAEANQSGETRRSGKLVLHKDYGFARWTMDYDQNDNRIKEQYFDITGNLRAPKDGVASAIMGYDERRQQIEVRYLEAAGKPHIIKGGYVRVTKRYDDCGNQTEQAHFNAEDRPALDSFGGAYKWRKLFDQRGNWTNQVYLDGNDHPVMTTDGFAREAARYDARGNKIEHAWYDARDQLVRQEGGYAKITYAYDAQDNRIEEAWFSETNQPVRNASGYAKLVSRFNERGERTEKIFQDESGQPIALAGGQARTISKYDARGNETEWGCYDVAGLPVLNTALRFHKWAKTFDEHGRWTNLVYLDVKGGLVTAVDGFARQIFRYNERGNLIETAFFDETGHAAPGTNGFARSIAQYDDGNLVELAYFDADDQPVHGPNGHARYTANYDRRGRRLDATYFYEPNNRVRVENGYAEVMIRYDEQGNQTRWACFGPAGQPVMDQADGTHELEKTWDDQAHLTSQAYRDTSGRLLMTTNGYARMEFKYDNLGYQIEARYFDEANRPVHTDTFAARVTKRYDEQGRKIEDTYFYEPDSPIQRDRSIARITQRYDESGNNTEWACFGTNGLPTSDLSIGNHMSKTTYDARNNATNIIYLDTQGRRVVTTNGFARLAARYNERGQRIEALYFDADDQPAHSGDGSAREVTRYDEAGRKAEVDSFYEPESQLRLKRGIGRITLRYDTHANVIAWACFDSNGQPIIDGSYGYHQWKKTYDARNNVTSLVYLDLHDQSIVTTAGYAQASYTYDRSGHLLTWACFGASGEPVLDPADGTHMWRKDYDERGRGTNVAYFGIHGELVRSAAGYARQATRYDESGEVIEVRYLDVDGQPLVSRVFFKVVAPDGQGAQLGLQAGDVVLTYEGTEISSDVELRRLTNQPGTALRELKIRRDNRIETFRVKPGRIGVELGTKYERPSPP